MHALGVQNREKGTTIVAVMHDINLAAQHCTDLILMKAGRVLAFGRYGRYDAGKSAAGL